MHTKDKLAAVLREAGLDAMAEKAASGYYDDWESPLPFPIIQLVKDLQAADAHALAQRAMNGDFDSTHEEAKAWANSPEGREVMDKLTRNR